jgi:hypothetical protein
MTCCSSFDATDLRLRAQAIRSREAEATMNKFVRQDRVRCANARGRVPTRSTYAVALDTRWQRAILWSLMTVAAACLIAVAQSPRIAGILSGLLVSEASAAEFSDASLSQLPVQLSQGQAQGQGSSDDLAAAMIVPNVFVGPIGVLAAADGSNAGPANVPAMQLAFNAIGGGIASMINYPFGFWCSDNFRVLAGTDASNLNRLCTGSVPAGAAVVIQENQPEGTPPDTVFGPCESVEVISQQTARVVLKTSYAESGESHENSLTGGALGGSGFRAVTVQQNNGAGSKQQGTNTIGGSLGSFTF